MNCGGSDYLPGNYLAPGGKTWSSRTTTTWRTLSRRWQPTITGWLKDGGGTPMANVQINAFATLNSIGYNQSAADNKGNYSVNVANGS